MFISAISHWRRFRSGHTLHSTRRNVGRHNGKAPLLAPLSSWPHVSAGKVSSRSFLRSFLRSAVPGFDGIFFRRFFIVVRYRRHIHKATATLNNCFKTLSYLKALYRCLSPTKRARLQFIHPDLLFLASTILDEFSNVQFYSADTLSRLPHTRTR